MARFLIYIDTKDLKELSRDTDVSVAKGFLQWTKDGLPGNIGTTRIKGWTPPPRFPALDPPPPVGGMGNKKHWASLFQVRPFTKGPTSPPSSRPLVSLGTVPQGSSQTRGRLPPPQVGPWFLLVNPRRRRFVPSPSGCPTPNHGVGHFIYSQTLRRCQFGSPQPGADSPPLRSAPGFKNKPVAPPVCPVVVMSVRYF